MIAHQEHKPLLRRRRHPSHCHRCPPASTFEVQLVRAAKFSVTRHPIPAKRQGSNIEGIIEPRRDCHLGAPAPEALRDRERRCDRPPTAPDQLAVPERPSWTWRQKTGTRSLAFQSQRPVGSERGGSHASAHIFRPPRSCGGQPDTVQFACAPEPGYRQPAWRSQARRALGLDFSHWVMDRASLESIFSFMQTQ